MSSEDEEMCVDTVPTKSTEVDQDNSVAVSSTITLLVGPSEQELEVQEDLLCSKCPHFHNAFAGNFLESQTKTFSFPDDDPEHFGNLCAWVLHGDLSRVNPNPTWIWLAKLWLFGEKYHIDELQNQAIDALHLKYASHLEGINISFDTLDYIAENTFSRSPLRRFFSDALTNGISLDQLAGRVDSIPHEFLADMVVALKTNLSMNDPSYTCLLTNPISTYYISSASSKSNAMPKPVDPSAASTEIYCQGQRCADKPREPIKDIMHICTNHNVTLCNDCKNEFRRHRRKMISLTTAPYRTAITGDITIIDGYVNEHGYWCDGPKCDGKAKAAQQKDWALMSGDRYHCLHCNNVDYCSVCIRGDLDCKDAGHPMLRIRPTFAKVVPMTGPVTLKKRQERFAKDLCWRCGADDHETDDCEAKQPLTMSHLEAED